MVSLRTQRARRRDDLRAASPQTLAGFTSRAAMVVGLASLAVVLLLFLWAANYVLLLAFAGILLAVFLQALADGVRVVTRLPRGWSLAIAVVGLVAITALGAWLLVPRVAEQLQELRTTLPAAFETMLEDARRYQWGEMMYGVASQIELAEMRPALAAGAATVLTTTMQAVIAVVVVLFVGIYLAVSPGMYINGTLHLVPKAHRGRAREIMHAVGEALRWWLIGRVIAMAFVGVTTALGLWLLGIPLFLTLGLIAGLLDFVPNIGPIVAAVPAVVLALAESPQKALYVVILYFVIQQVESYIVTPIVQQKAVKLPAALAVVAQILFFILAGPIGLLLATPLAAAALVVVKALYVQDTLGDGAVSINARD